MFKWSKSGHWPWGKFQSAISHGHGQCLTPKLIRKCKFKLFNTSIKWFQYKPKSILNLTIDIPRNRDRDRDNLGRTSFNQQSAMGQKCFRWWVYFLLTIYKMSARLYSWNVYCIKYLSVWGQRVFLSGNKTTFSLTDDMKSSECWIEFTLADRYNIAWIEIVNRYFW